MFAEKSLCYLWKILLIRLAGLEECFTSVSITNFWSDLAPLWLRKTSRALRDNPFIPEPDFSLAHPRFEPGVGGRPVKLKLLGSWSRLWDLTRREPRDNLNFPSNSLKVGCLLTMGLEPGSEASLGSQSGPEHGMGVDSSELFRLSLASLVLVFLVRIFLLAEKTIAFPEASNNFDFLKAGLFGWPAESKCIRKIHQSWICHHAEPRVILLYSTKLCTLYTCK